MKFSAGDLITIKGREPFWSKSGWILPGSIGIILEIPSGDNHLYKVAIAGAAPDLWSAEKLQPLSPSEPQQLALPGL